MARVVGRVHVVGAGAEGVGPTLLLTMHKRGQYSTDETLCEALWFNISDCACRVANSTRVKLSATAAVFATRVAPCHLSGLPSLVFHLSTAGTEALTVHGPAVAPAAASLPSYVGAMNAFVVRQFPALAVVQHGGGPSTDSAPVHDSRGIGAYGAWKGRAGLRVWALPVRTGAGDEEGRWKRRRADEVGTELTAAAETIACCYLVCVDNGVAEAPPFVLLVLDCPSPALAVRVGEACGGIRALCPTPPSLILHLAERGVTASGEYAALLLQLRVEVQSGARHVFVSGGGPEVDPGAAGTRWTHFPRAAAHTAALHAAWPALYPLLLHPPAGTGGRPGMSLLLEASAPTAEEGWILAPSTPAVLPAGGARRVLEGCMQWYTRAPPRTEGSNRGAAAALRLSLAGGTPEAPAPALPPPPPVNDATSARTGYASVSILGTGAAAPSALRSCSAIYAQLTPGPVPEGVLIDCGEGALGKLLLQEAGEPSLDRIGGLLLIWISHLHADHHSGLPAVLAARVRDASVAGRRPVPLLVAGPRALRNLLLTYTAMIAAAGRAEGWWGAEEAGEDGLHGMCRFVDIRGGDDVTLLLREDRSGEAREGASLVRFRSVAVEHAGEAYGGIATFALPPPVGGGGTGPTDALVLVYSGDTRPCNALVEAGVEGAACALTAAEGCGGGRVRVLLVHEATFAEEGGDEAGSGCGGSTAHLGAGAAGGNGGKPKRTAAEHARSKRHSTVGEAVDVSCRLAASLQRLAGAPSQAGAAPVALGLLPPVLTHFSARYAPAGDVTGAGGASGDAEGGLEASAAVSVDPFVSVRGVWVLMAADGLRLPVFA